MGYTFQMLVWYTPIHGKREQMEVCVASPKHEEIFALEPSDRPRKVFVGGGGLFIDVRPTGLKVWRIKYRVNNKEQLKTIGRFPSMSLEQAQRAAIDLRAINDLRKEGVDPAITERIERESVAASRIFNTITRLHNERIEQILSIPPTEGYQVYFIRVIGKDWIKIGFSKDPESRMVRLRCGQPYDLEIMATMPGGELHEALLHEAFREELIRGEWFTLSDRLRAFIEQIKC